MKVDYIIVGLGLAGLSLAERLTQEKKSFIVYENESQTSSLVAGGVYNPVILKRFTPVWRAKEQLSYSIPFYEALEKKFDTSFDTKFSTRKIFKSIEDQNNWFQACDKPMLSEFMNPSIIHGKVEGLIADYGFGEVWQTGRLDTHVLVELYRDYLKKEKIIRFENFQYDAFRIMGESLHYKDIISDRIVFCEGYGIVHNPFFNYLPLNGTKGELITIYAPNLNLNFLVKSTLFVLPLGDDFYKVGATFEWDDKTSKPTVKGRDELVEKLKKVISVPYNIVNQTAGVRPTVKDRRPLVGMHPKHPNLAVLNGLGTRGVMIAPWAANELFNHLEKGAQLDKEINITRFNQ